MSAVTLEPIRDVLAFEHEKVWHPAEYRDMTLHAELGGRVCAALQAPAATGLRAAVGGTA
jgi:hypothetical protein